MSQYPGPVERIYIQQGPSQSNGMGIAGFVVSLVGFISCGLLSPIGCILSLMGLRQEPRGLAIAGLVLGLVGSAWLALFGFACIAGTLGLSVAAKTAGAALSTSVSVTSVCSVVQEYGQAHQGKLPSEKELKAVLQRDGKPTKDAWGNELRYRITGASNYEVRSAGPDGKFDTGDDLTECDSIQANKLPDPEAGPKRPGRTPAHQDAEN